MIYPATKAAGLSRSVWTIAATKFGKYHLMGRVWRRLIALALLEGTDLPDHPHSSDTSFHLQIEAMKLAFADAQRYIADPEQVEVPADRLARIRTYIAARRELIGPRAHLPETRRACSWRHRVSLHG